MSDPIGGFGKPGDVLRTISDSDLQALGAAGQHVAERYGCMVTIGDDPPSFRGSGTLVQIGTETFVATAKHLFKDLDQDARACFWWGHENEHECIAVRDLRWPSADLDVAAARLSRCTGPGVALGQLDLEARTDDQTLWLVSGISGQFVDADPRTRVLDAVWWMLGLCPLPQSRWPKLQRHLAPDRDLFAHYSNQYALDQHGATMTAVDPRGLSGGGMWSIAAPGDQIWDPSTAARLIGIQFATEAHQWNWLFGTKVSHWLKLVRDNWIATAALIDPRLKAGK